MQKLSSYSFLSILFLLICGSGGYSQSSFPPRLEEITLHTDRNLYLSGEPIWVHVNYTLPTDSSYLLSKVLYIELFNNELEVVASQKLKISQSLLSAKISIPESAKTGYYLLRAYTKYAQNFPVWEMETLIISVVNPVHPLAGLPFQGMDDQIQLVAQHHQPIVFQIKEPLAKEVKSIKLINNREGTNAEIDYYPNGLGKVTYRPKKGDQLQLQILLNQGDTIHSQSFPVADKSLQITTQVNANELNLIFSEIPTQHKDLIVKVKNLNSGIENQFTTEVHQQKSFMRLPNSQTGIGLCQISILDATYKLLDDLLYFIPKPKEKTPTTPIKSAAFAGSEFTLNLDKINLSSYPLSVSCVKQGTTHTNSSILPPYLIENPWYVTRFIMEQQNPSEEINDQIQIVLTIQQDKILKQLEPITDSLILPEFYGMNLEGRVLDSKNHQPIYNKLIYCALLGEQSQFHATQTTTEGHFVFTLNQTTKLKDIYVGTSSPDEIESTIIVKNGFCPTPPLWNGCHFAPDSSMSSTITAMYFNLQVNQLFKIDRSKSIQQKTHFKKLFGTPSSTIELSNYVQLSSTQEVFNELVPFVKARKKGEHFKFIVLDETLNIEYDDPLVIIDQVPYNNIDEILQLQPTEIEKIEVISRVYAYGNQLYNGIIMITTTAGNLARMPLPSGSIFVEFETYENESHFVPIHQTGKETKLPDFANTSYYKTIQKPGSASINIPLPQSIGTYDIIVASLKKPGQVIHHQTVEIKANPPQIQH